MTTIENELAGARASSPAAVEFSACTNGQLKTTGRPNRRARQENLLHGKRSRLFISSSKFVVFRVPEESVKKLKDTCQHYQMLAGQTLPVTFFLLLSLMSTIEDA